MPELKYKPQYPSLEESIKIGEVLNRLYKEAFEANKKNNLGIHSQYVKLRHNHEMELCDKDCKQCCKEGKENQDRTFFDACRWSATNPERAKELRRRFPKVLTVRGLKNKDKQLRQAATQSIGG